VSRFLVRRLLLLVPVLTGVSVIVFLVLHLAPGDPAEIMLGSQATQADRMRLRADLGLDDPLYVQYARWMGHVVQGDLGRSLWMRRPVLGEVPASIPQPSRRRPRRARRRASPSLRAHSGLHRHLAGAVRRRRPAAVSSGEAMKLALVSFFVVVASTVAHAGEITVLCPRGVQQAVAAAAEDFQRETRHSVWLSYGTADTILQRAPNVEFDVVINNAAGLMELETRGVLRPGTRVMLGRAGTGQHVVLYAAGVSRRSAAPDVAQAFLTHLKSAAARAHFEAGGIEPAK
jgi:hypothetical protein